jgi:hypothetical protein
MKHPLMLIQTGTYSDVGYMEDIHKAAQTANTHTHTKNCVTEHISSKHDRDIIKSENNEPILLLFIFLTNKINTEYVLLLTTLIF